MLTAPLRDIELSYSRSGSGPPVVLVHCSCVDGRVWHVHSEALAKRFEVIVPDQRYFGRDAWPDDGEKFSVASHANDLVALLKYLDLGPVSCVGWSYGAAVVITATLDAPSLFRNIVIYEPAMASHIANVSDRETALLDRQKMLAPALQLLDQKQPERATEAFIDAINDKPGTFRSLAKHLQQRILEARRTLALLAAAPPPPTRAEHLKQLSCPATIAYGAKTRPFYRLAAQSAAESIPDDRLCEIPGARHMWPVERVEDCIEFLLASASVGSDATHKT